LGRSAIRERLYIRHGSFTGKGPWKSADDLELATLGWVTVKICEMLGH